MSNQICSCFSLKFITLLFETLKLKFRCNIFVMFPNWIWIDTCFLICRVIGSSSSSLLKKKKKWWDALLCVGGNDRLTKKPQIPIYHKAWDDDYTRMLFFKHFVSFNLIIINKDNIICISFVSTTKYTFLNFILIKNLSYLMYQVIIHCDLYLSLISFYNLSPHCENYYQEKFVTEFGNVPLN